MTDRQKEEQGKGRRFLGMNPMKALFAGEYVLQGLANPFQGITYHSFFRHFHFTYGLSEAATQALFSRSYLAWSFKPVIGFFMDAYGKTRTALILLLASGAGLFLLTPLVDRGVLIFFWLMFVLSVLFACTDVAVDRATVIDGDQESKIRNRSRASAVGVNQAICWAAIYGTSILSAFSGGWIADNLSIHVLLPALALAPLAVLVIVWHLPRDTAPTIPLKTSVAQFWDGLNTGPVLWIVVFFFLFHFQPAMGALWTNYLISEIRFTQTQIGYAESVSYAGYFLGVLAFAWLGIKWQERLGFRRLFRIYILLSMGIQLTQYLLIEPWFSGVTGRMAQWLPLVSLETVRWGYYAAYQFLAAILMSMIRMSTFSLVGAVIPVAAAGSLFAGFMSVSNLAYSFSYASGAWLYENGLDLAIFRFLQTRLFGVPAVSGDTMSIALLILTGSLAYGLSFLTVHMLPDRAGTNISDETETGENRDVRDLGRPFLNRVNRISLVSGSLAWGALLLSDGMDFFSAAILVFFMTAFLRRLFLNRKLRRAPGGK